MFVPMWVIWGVAALVVAPIAIKGAWRLFMLFAIWDAKSLRGP